MKIALAQLNYHVGNFEANTAQMIQVLEDMKSQNVDLVVFSELSICGYIPYDFLDYPEFVELCEATAKKVASYCTNIACIIGLPIKNEQAEGKDLFNAAYFIENTMVKHVVKKALLPTYDVFDEYRYFEPGNTFQCVDFKGHKIALTICEDLWNINENPLYQTRPMDVLIKEKPDFMINIAASPFTYSKDDDRLQVMKTNVAQYQIPLFYVNQVGAQTEIIFDGGSLVLDQNQNICAEMAYFKPDVQIFEMENGKLLNAHPVTPQAESDIAQIHQALILGIKDYFQKSGFQKAILGLSGGIDSAVVAALAAEALGAENVMGILMPSEFSSDHSIQDAVDLAKNIGCKYEIIPIKTAAHAFEETMAPHFKDTPFNVAEENIQARCRAIIVMAMSNKFGPILLNTSNKSECAVGYGTLYGDMAGALSVIGDVYKTQVYQLARYLNRNGEIIPENTITKAPSAELRPNQKDSDSLPDYDILDTILYQYIEKFKTTTQIIAMGYDEALVRRIIKLVNGAEFKRFQCSPILRVSPKAFGVGRKIPLVAKFI